MKRFYKTIAMLAAVAATFASCSKIEEKQLEPVQPNDEEKEYVYTFALGESAETKAILGSDANGKFIQWTSGDQLGSITTKSQGYSSITPASGETPATFSIYSKGGLTAGNTINVWYPYRTKYTDATAVSLLIPNEQEQRSADNKFDFKAMPMVTSQITVTSEMASATDNTTLSTINMVCLGSVINFKVFSTNATYVTEKVKSVTFNARNSDNSSDANIAGAFTKNLTTVDPSNESTLTISSFTTGYSSVVTSPRSASAIGADKEHALDLYMVVAPGSYQGTIVVETDAAVYTYTLSSAKTLVRGGFKAFGLDLKNAGTRALPVDYVTLPWESAESGEGVGKADLNDVVGVSVSADNDYASGPYYIKFTGNSHNITAKTDSEIGSVSVAVKSNSAGSGATLSEIIISSSADGSSWTEVERFDLPAAGSTDVFTTSTDFASTARYVKIGFNKALNNAGIGRIAISKPSTDPKIVADAIAINALGGTDLFADYEARNFVDDVTVSAYSGCITAATIEGGRIKYTAAANYGTSSASGSITLHSASAAASDKVVNVTQSGDTFSQNGASGTPLVLTIPAASETVTIDLTSTVFGWNAAVTPATGKNLTIQTGPSTFVASTTGAKDADPQTITISSTEDAPTSGDPITLGTLALYRNGNASDTQAFAITIKKAVAGATLTNGAQYDYTFTDNPFSDKSDTQTLGSMSWDYETDSDYHVYDSNSGYACLHYGSSSKTVSYANFTLGYLAYCNSATAKLVKTVKIKARGNGTDPKLEVLVGGVSIEEKTITNTMTEYTFTVTGEKYGDIEIRLSYSSAAKKNLCIQQVKINK